VLAQGVEKALPDEAVLNEAKGAGDLTDPLRTNDDLLHHGLRPPWWRSLNRKKAGKLSSPFLQEMGSHLESGNICWISRPSLQDPLWQESGGKCLELKDKKRLTRPFLQDSPGVFGPALSAGADYAVRTQDDLPGISESSPGSALSSTGGFPSRLGGSPGPSSFSLAASAVSSVAGIRSCCSIVESLSGDRAEKVSGTSSWHTESSGAWSSLQGKTTTLNRHSPWGKNKNQIHKSRIFNSERK